MNMDIHSQAEELNKKHRRKRTWYKILFVPICLVVFVTTYALILPAITMESTPDTYCGIAEHVHTDDCYELPGSRLTRRSNAPPGPIWARASTSSTSTTASVLMIAVSCCVRWPSRTSTSTQTHAMTVTP